ncbi:MAG: putative dithiol-disulfide isomerase involved in polyketide biosynthesis [Actinoallomurus sp.]|jgi:predicted DsbA family dithiol-disulfide isomerase|nr:putative dithiol-disulfide isomerase involved in polyketide biosynthesis [Actinoallomurus sp.]
MTDSDTAASTAVALPGLANPDRRVVTVWSDIGCPWATLALITLHDRARARGDALLVDHRAFPLELFNRRPTPKPVVDTEVEALVRRLPELGWTPWAALDSTYPVTTLPAMEAVQACKLPEIGGLPASDELDAALRRAFYQDGRCISVHAVILDAAEECPHVDAERLAAALAQGVGRAAVYQQWSIAQRPEVDGSPHLFTIGGLDVHNPGVTYHWAGTSADRVLHLDDYRLEWADELLNTLADG